ncbi:phosphoglycolate phosphatase [Streptomyces carminius]|uniref:Phosphoglycolate phosphatase n=1 Tax=Streptomyces carminius TaxID=2665496 RepID=A0A2M8M0F2_9ACTN|nr:HAD hydrolase-like protein [Streptomyces carminius]PJE96984.1 phosphoglycolate phosphatase [Streptomyces carminius]PJE97693.1 phosphoglycolate phosphatase [Streptomyces carminius]
MVLVLWDIDHTLIDTRGVGRELSAEAFHRTTGLQMRQQAKVDGITEAVIFRETAKLHGLTTDRADFERFARELVAAHQRRIADLRERGCALPGAAAALDALAAQPDVRQSVLTGNVRGVAEIKLQTFGLDQHIGWEAGAYGEDDDVRSELVRIALERATLTPADAVLIGDTPADVEASHDSGVRIIAVASGHSNEADLQAAGADVVLPDLQNTDLLLKLVLHSTTPEHSRPSTSINRLVE